MQNYGCLLHQLARVYLELACSFNFGLQVKTKFDWTTAHITNFTQFLALIAQGSTVYMNYEIVINSKLCFAISIWNQVISFQNWIMVYCQSNYEFKILFENSIFPKRKHMVTECHSSMHHNSSLKTRIKYVSHFAFWCLLVEWFVILSCSCFFSNIRITMSFLYFFNFSVILIVFIYMLFAETSPFLL